MSAQLTDNGLHKRYYQAPDAVGAGHNDCGTTGGEFAEPLDLNSPEALAAGPNRRSFLKAAGFAFAGAALGSGGCSRPADRKALPYLNAPEETIPGNAYWYASACGACPAGCGVLARTIDGRPIKLEGNPDHPLNSGGLCAVGQASLLGLYDSRRLRGPLAGGRDSSWADVDAQITRQLQALKSGGGTGPARAVRFLCGTITSPTTNAQIDALLAQFPDGRKVVYDGRLSAASILDAHQRTHGVRVLPRYRFDRAELIVGIDCDFLGTWISPVEFTRVYALARKPRGTLPAMARHAQVEARMSLTGAKADQRIVMAPGEVDAFVAALASAVGAAAGHKLELTAPDRGDTGPARQLADELWNARGRSLLVCGSERLETQLLVNLINHLLGNYGQTLDLDSPSLQRQGDDRAFAALREEVAAGKVAALFIHGLNPVYDLPDGEALAGELKKIPLVVSFSERVDETSAHAGFVCPGHHFLESWQDHESIAGVVTVAQPAIAPLFQTRGLIESLSAWRGVPAPEYDLLQQSWRDTVFKRQSKETSFQRFWDETVQRGYAEVSADRGAVGRFNASAAQGLAVAAPSAPPGKDAFELVVYPTVAMLDGRHAHNPWLQELPDPVTKIAWDNYASFSPRSAAELGVVDGDVVRLSTQSAGGTRTIELPAHVQPGQHDRVVAVAMGYGRQGTDRFADLGPRWLEGKPTVLPGKSVGANVAPLAAASIVRVTRTGARHELACTQLHHSIDVPANLARPEQRRRPVAQETTLAALAALSHPQPHQATAPADMWASDHAYPGRKWGMTIDTNACTGCSACVVACQAENNIPVVGKDEVRRQRDMRWMRIDRYYAEAPAPDNGSGPSADVGVLFQPMLCQQCDNAPCETVCPVLATVHSSEGINQQIYNRCVGTRYCANNCPYKTRRFNWFDYDHGDQLQNMVLNPHVTVRSRGVMEKCSFCVQRVQEARSRAKLRGAELADEDVMTACQQSCPARAITFGDVNDPKSAVSTASADPRHFRVLEELNVKPSIAYLKVVRNRPNEPGHGAAPEHRAFAPAKEAGHV